MSLEHLAWYGWLLLAISTSSFIHQVVNAAWLVRTGKEGTSSFLLPVAGLITVLWMVTT